MSKSTNSATVRQFEPDSHYVPYQSSLRTIGEYLDAENRTNVRVLEVLTGFDLFSQSTKDDGSITRVHFPHDDLYAQALRPYARKRFGIRSQSRPQSRYGDVFRAIGYALEDAHAFFIILEEVPDGYLLTYQQHGRDSGFLLNKRYIVMTPDRISALIRAAVARRAKR